MRIIFFTTLIFRICTVASTEARSGSNRAERSREDAKGAINWDIHENRNRDLVEIDPSNANRSFGEKELLVVRFDASDSSTTATEDELFDDIFGADITFTKQINLCSHGKFKINPATGKNINNGVTTIQLDRVVGETTSTLIEKVDKNSESLLGRPLNQFNHVMFCMPPGTMFSEPGSEPTTKWHAFAPGDWRYTDFVTVFNDEWCSSISAGMHEIGHNLGLGHSNEAGSFYDDETGSMGYSGLEDTFAARRCYNPSKSWQLGWYSDYSQRYDPFVDAPFQTILTGITRPPENGDPYKNILLQIPNGQTNLYVGYNLADDFNSGTVEGRNQVLVNEEEPGRRTNSNLLAKLSRGDSYKIQNYQDSGETLIIQVDSNFWNDKEALVKVYFEGNDFTKKPDCSEGQVRFEVSVKTDTYPKDTSWELIDEGTNRIVASRSNFKPQTNHDDLICIDREKEFTFTLYDDYADGICCEHGWGDFSVFLDGKEIFHGGEFRSISTSHSFRTNKAETSSTCRDDNFFRYKRLRKCSWVGSDTKNRCSKQWLGKPIYEYCPATCGLCVPILEQDSVEKINRKIEHNIFCRDESTYRFRNKYSCDWVAKNTAMRCERLWRGTKVKKHCKATCNFCENTRNV